MVTHLTLGYLFDLYTRITWYDKVLHFGNSLLVGFLAFLLVYVAHFLRHERRHPWLDVVAKHARDARARLAVGEIGEFASDQGCSARTRRLADAVAARRHDVGSDPRRCRRRARREVLRPSTSCINRSAAAAASRSWRTSTPGRRERPPTGSHLAPRAGANFRG